MIALLCDLTCCFRFVVEIPHNIAIAAEDLWENVNRSDFGLWLQNTADKANLWANDNYLLFSAHQFSMPLKYLYTNTASFLQKSDITWLPALPNLQTLSYKDIELVLENFYTNFILPYGRLFAAIGGDFQVWDRLFMLHRRNPIKYHWLIPVPGEWHWQWHILIAIYRYLIVNNNNLLLYRLYYKSILLPLSEVLGFRILDSKAANFHYAEDLLQMVTIAVHKWIVTQKQQHPNLTIVQWLHSIKHHRVAYELAYACVHYFIPYWITRSSVKWNKFEDNAQLWRYWTHVFLATGKRNYCLMSIRYLLLMKSLHPEVRKLLDDHKVLSFSGEAGSGIPLDGVCELVSYTSTTMHLQQATNW